MTTAEALYKANQLEGLAAYYGYLADTYERLEPGSQQAKVYADEAAARLRAAERLRGGNGEAA